MPSQDAIRAYRLARLSGWLAENKDGIAAYNEFVEQHGTFSDTLRTF